MKETVKQYI